MHGRIVAYLPGYVTHRKPKPYNIHDVPGGDLTHLIYAFAGFKQQGSDWVADYPEPDDPTNNFVALADLKRKWPQLRILISVGGYANSQQVDARGRPIFGVIASTDHSRQVFVNSCLNLFFEALANTRHQPTLFDGVDIDWEYPRDTTDQQNFTLLLQEFHKQLDALDRRTGRPFELSIAIDVKPRNIDVPSVAATVDWLNIMAYVAHQPNHSPHNTFTDFNSPQNASPSEPQQNRTWDIDDGIQKYLLNGIPADRLVLGVNAYARVYAGVQNVNYGVYQQYSGPGGDNGVLPYAELVSNEILTYESHWDSATGSAYLYSPEHNVWISYDGTRSVKEKADYANQHRLGGMMLWELSADAQNVRDPSKPPSSSLIATMRANLHSSQLQATHAARRP